MEHHMGEGFVGAGLAHKAEVGGPDRVLGPRVGDRHRGDRLGRGADRAPDAEVVEEAARPRGHCHSAQAAGRGGGVADREGGAGRRAFDGQRQRKSRYAAARDEDIQGAEPGTRKV